MPARDRETFLQTILAYRTRGESQLLATGVTPDCELAAELAQAGSDRRYGVNLICRPNHAVIEQIIAIQRRLAEYEPAQYYPPPQDLHLTLVEICYSRAEEEAEKIAAAAQSHLSCLLEPESPPVLNDPLLAYDAHGAALNFLPRDQRLQHVRHAIRESLAHHAIPVLSRYLPQSAHVTLMRYIGPLQTPAVRWVDLLKNCCVSPELEWVLAEVWLTWGATWYGMRDRTQRHGPIRLKEMLK